MREWTNCVQHPLGVTCLAAEVVSVLPVFAVQVPGC